MQLWIPVLCVVALGLQAPQPLKPALSDQNLLRNGGFESWSLGHSFQGAVGPDLWHAMGDTSDVFTQADLAFTRVTGCPPAGSGGTAMQVRANLPQNYVSQRVQGFAELAGANVTFSLDVRPLFPLATARIEVDDGVGTSAALVQVAAGSWGRVTVHHTVATCPTKLEFKLFPEQTLDVDEAMAVVGRVASAPFVPRGNSELDADDVPLGTVIDWYRFDTSVPIPAGFAICDGSAVSDPASPFVGRPTPNLADRFVRGVTDPASIGIAGGSSTHSHGASSGENEGGHGSPAGDWWFIEWQDFDQMRVARDGHDHDISVGSASSLPPYFGLLKLVRVR